MPEEIKTLSSQLAQDPDSLVFLRLGELLRQKGQFDAAHRVALTGLERHPHLADAHDLYARILADKRDYERAFDEWDMTLRIAPNHIGALKGLAFLYFKVGDVGQAVAHLEAARQHAPDDPGVAQALALAQGGGGPGGVPDAARAAAAAAEELAPAAPAAAPLEEARVFAGLEGAQEGLLLLDAKGQVLGGALKDPHGQDVTDAVAALAASLASRLRRAMEAAGLGVSLFWHLQCDQGGLLVVPTPSGVLIVAVAEPDVNVGLVRLELLRAAEAVG